MCKTPFDGLISLRDASERWGKDESMLRMYIRTGKIIEGQEARKFGKQWVVTEAAMLRLYGSPKDKV